ncbi:MAG: hypothetical protein IT382_21940 [Deltaproteobacteria bacterium]|nr:hypothetical protein [Deltaproteobacteria bacterium]
MDASPYELAAQLLVSEPPASRNRHFQAYQDPTTRRAYALYRRLRALVLELEEAERQGVSVAVEPRTRAGVAIMRLVWETAHARRAAWLELPAWRALLAHPAAARVLGPQVAGPLAKKSA